MKAAFLSLPRTVVVLGGVSMFNDVASDMLAPLLPLFLTITLGGGPVIVGLIEGVAEATASILKLVAGWLADRGWNQKGLVIGGYGLSNTARPLIGAAVSWAPVLVLRFLDRVGKGLRTAPRDAMIAASVSPAISGRAFGFHRALDHGGAVVGPLLAYTMLEAQVPLRHIFFASAIPGLLVMLLLIFGLPRTTASPPAASAPRFAWRELDSRLRGLIIASAALALAAVPDAFLVLWMEARGFSILWVPLLWAAMHAVKGMVAMPFGMLSDRTSRLAVVIGGWCARVMLLLALGWFSNGIGLAWGMLLAYAAAVASTEGAERALIGDVAPPESKATAFGTYHMLSGLCALPGALLFGTLWEWAGMGTAFAVAAAMTAVSAAALVTIARRG
ncbi:MAG: MFS transporter [Gammaproteobacteria bacterium]